MKKAIKIAALIVAIGGSSLASKAQTTQTTSSIGVILKLGAESGLAFGSSKELHKWSLGGFVGVDIPVTNQLFAVVNAGYQNNFGVKNIAGTGIDAPDDHLLPAKAGLKFFPVKFLYVQGEAGAIFALNKQDAGYTKTAVFAYTPSVGVLLPLGSSSFLDAGLIYKGSTKFNDYDSSKENTLGVRIAYAFAIK